MCTATPECAAYTFATGLDCAEQKCFLVTSCENVQATACGKDPSGEYVSFRKVGSDVYYNNDTDVLAFSNVMFKGNRDYMGVYGQEVEMRTGSPGSFEVFTIKKAGVRQRSCCNKNGKFAYLDLMEDGRYGFPASKIECEAKCRGFAGCNFFEVNPSESTSWCTGSAECALHCPVDFDEPHSIYALVNDQRGCADGYTQYAGENLGAVNGRGNGEIVNTCGKCGELCSAEEACNSYYCSLPKAGVKQCHLSERIHASVGTESVANYTLLAALNQTHGDGVGYFCIKGQDVLAGSIARGKPVMQSSTNQSGIAQRAVDGNTAQDFNKQSCTHTGKQFEPWWRIDLQRQAGSINTVTVWNRADAHGNRLSNFQVRVGHSGVMSEAAVCDNKTFTAPQGESRTVKCRGLVGKYVFVTIPGRTEILTLCEVSVVPMGAADGILYSTSEMSPSARIESTRPVAGMTNTHDQVAPVAAIGVGPLSAPYVYPNISQGSIPPRKNMTTVENLPLTQQLQLPAKVKSTPPEYSVVLCSITIAPVKMEQAAVAAFGQAIKMAFATAAKGAVSVHQVDLIRTQEASGEEDDIATSGEPNPHSPSVPAPMVEITLRVMGDSTDQAKKVAHNVQSAVKSGELIEQIELGFQRGGIQITPFEPLRMDKLTLQKIVIKLQDIHTCKKTDCAPELSVGVSASNFGTVAPSETDDADIVLDLLYDTEELAI